MTSEKLTEIERVNKLWDAVFGTRVNGVYTPGLVEQMTVVLPLIKVLRNILAVGKWAIITFVGAMLVGLANLLTIAN